jgi:cytochrome c553
VMRDVARFLDSHERVRVANHYAALPVPVEEGLVPAAPVRSALYERACEQCHGVDGAGTPLGPPLAGQPAFYLAQQLRDWQVSKRRNDGNHEMLKVAQALSAAEVADVSLHLSRIPPRPAHPVR